MQYVIEKYGLFFSVKIIHPWFKDGICPYLSIEPDESTRLSFRKMHLISRYHLGELRVMGLLTEADDNSRWTDETSGKNRFSFLLKLTDNTFFEVTKLDVTGFPGQVFFYTNSGKALKLSSAKCMLVDRYLTLSFEKGKTPKQVRILAQNESELLQQELEKSATDFKYDMSGRKSGLYSAVLQFAKADQKQILHFYFDPMARRQSILGVLEILPGSEVRLARENKNQFTISYESLE